METLVPVPSRAYPQSFPVHAWSGLMVFATICSAQPTEWQIEPVDAPPLFANMTDRSLCLDSVGQPHAAFGQDHLYHAWHDGRAWMVETVDGSPGVGEHASMAAGTDGILHIAYYDELNDDLKYALYDGVAWHVEVVGNGGRFTSVALDSLGEPHIAYQEETLNYAWKGSGGWQIEAIDSSGSPGGFASLTLDRWGRSHISHYEAMGGNLLYSFSDSAGWHTETVDSADDVGWYSSVAVDSTGSPRISYYDRGQYSVAFARRDSTVWSIESLGRGGSWTSLALDAEGAPHIAFCTTSGPVHAHYSDSTWVMETLEGSADHASLAIGERSEIHMSYVVDDYFAEIRELRYAARRDSGWAIATVAEAADVGTHAALALDHEGFLRACYVNSVDKRIRYAVQTPTGWSVQSLGVAGIDLSLAVDGDDYPHVTAFEEATTSIIHLYMDETGWRNEIVDSTAGFGGYTSLALGADDVPHVTYRADRKLTYAVKVDSIWVIESLGPDEGYHTSLVLDAVGRPHIAHHSLATHLAYTYRDETAWKTEVADAGGEGGLYCSLKLDPAGAPHIAHFDNFFANLRYAYKDTTGWHRETADTQSNAGKHASLALDPQGRPFVTYYNSQSANLKFAYRNGGVWRRSTIASEGHVGEWSRLEVDDQSYARVVYYDATRGDLMYAHADALGSDPWSDKPLGPQVLRIIGVSPNPASGRTTVFLDRGSQYSWETRVVDCRLFDMCGREVASRSCPLPRGTNQIPLLLAGTDRHPLPAGAYHLRVHADGISSGAGTPLIILP